MAAWVDLASLHTPAVNARPPVAWANGIVTDLNNLKGTKLATVATSETTTSVAMTNLATVGPVVTVDTAASVLVILSAQASNTGANANFMSVAVSGATTIAAGFDDVLLYTHALIGGLVSSMGILTGLTPGSNTFTAKYCVSAGTGTWLRRKIAVIPIF